MGNVILKNKRVRTFFLLFFILGRSGQVTVAVSSSSEEWASNVRRVLGAMVQQNVAKLIPQISRVKFDPVLTHSVMAKLRERGGGGGG